MPNYALRAFPGAAMINSMDSRFAFRISSIIGLLAIALGAFGAHGLEKTLVANETVDIWDTAVSYHLPHAILLAILALSRPFPKAIWISMTLGVLIFSGTLYVLALTNIKWLGAITPIGGTLMMVAWGNAGLQRLGQKSNSFRM